MLNVEASVVIFEQPLWIKATEIIQTLYLKIILILGGFHIIMSFAGSGGTTMSGSGLDTTLHS